MKVSGAGSLLQQDPRGGPLPPSSSHAGAGVLARHPKGVQLSVPKDPKEAHSSRATDVIKNEEFFLGLPWAHRLSR